MKGHWNSDLVVKILLIGVLIAGLVYLFHPAEGPFLVMINGEPLTDSVVQLAGLPAMLVILFFTAVLSVLAFLGVGLFMFLGILMLLVLGVFIVAPYIWPLLLVILIIIFIMSFNEKREG